MNVKEFEAKLRDNPGPGASRFLNNLDFLSEKEREQILGKCLAEYEKEMNYDAAREV